MAYRALLSLGVTLGLAVGAMPASAQSAKPAVDVDTLIKATRTVCTRNLEGPECGASQRRLVDAVRRQHALKARRDTGSEQIDALVASLS